jgi:hypothetical protein
VQTKVDEILTWEEREEAERDTRFVELGLYLCEVRAGQYCDREIKRVQNWPFRRNLINPDPEMSTKRWG